MVRSRSETPTPTHRDKRTRSRFCSFPQTAVKSVGLREITLALQLFAVQVENPLTVPHCRKSPHRLTTRPGRELGVRRKRDERDWSQPRTSWPGASSGSRLHASQANGTSRTADTRRPCEPQWRWPRIGRIRRGPALQRPPCSRRRGGCRARARGWGLPFGTLGGYSSGNMEAP